MQLTWTRGRTLLACTCAATVLVTGCSADADGGSGPTSGATSPGGTASAPPSSSADPSGQWTTGLDSRPTMAITSTDSVYVTTAGSGRSSPQVFRLDDETGEELAHRTAVGQTKDLTGSPDGLLWVATERHPDQPAGTGINLFDATTLLVVDEIAVPDVPLSLANVGDTVWVGSRESIFVLDRASHEVVATYPVSAPAYQLVTFPGRDHVLAVEGSVLEVISLDGEQLGHLEVPSNGSVTAALSGDSVWVRVPVDTDSELRRYSVPALDELDVGPRFDSASGGVAMAGTDVWAVDERSDELVCLDSGGTATAHPADGAVGVLQVMGNGESNSARLLLALDRGVQVRVLDCTDG